MGGRRCLFLSLFILLCFQTSSAIYCFSCSSITNAACGDDFRISTSDGSIRSECDGSCVKRRGERVSGTVRRIEISRSCILRRSEGCYKEVFNNLDVYSCSCNNQFCNPSSRISLSLLSVLSVAFSVLCFCFLL